MPEPNNEFTQVTSFQSESIGEPGSRTFRILVDSGSSSAAIWLEKEQLFELAMAVQRLLATMEERPDSEGPPPQNKEAAGLTKLDFKVGRLAVGNDPDSGLFVIDAHDTEDTEDAPATVRLWVNQNQAEEFAEEAVRICASGRPICHLCGRPIDRDGHFCVRLNGHNKQQTDI